MLPVGRHLHIYWDDGVRMWASFACMKRLLLLCLLIVPVAVQAQMDTVQIEPVSREAMMGGPGAGPGTGGGGMMRRGGGMRMQEGRIQLPFAPLSQIFATAYDVDASFVTFKGKIDGTDTYKLLVVAADGTTASAKAALRKQLQTQFGVVVDEAEEPRLVDLLTPRKGIAEPPASQQQPGNGGMNMRTMQPGQPMTLPAMDMASVTRLLSRFNTRPVVDNTGWKQRYDFKLNWSPMEGPDMLAAALDEQGLELQTETRPMRVLKVTKPKEKK